MAEESWENPNSMLAIIYLLWIQIVHWNISDSM